MMVVMTGMKVMMEMTIMTTMMIVMAEMKVMMVMTVMKIIMTGMTITPMVMMLNMLVAAKGRKENTKQDKSEKESLAHRPIHTPTADIKANTKRNGCLQNPSTLM